VDGIVVRPFEEPDRDAVAAIHDPAFPDSHIPGHRVDEGPRGRFVRVATDGDTIVGYAAADRQEDGSGYLDLVGVAAGERGRGIGALLVAEVVDVARANKCDRIHLTVRETNTVARGLYERLGFTEERLIRPYRLGFSLR
jgi:ribosomal protein S18 acetylase RimI-like enzyme